MMFLSVGISEFCVLTICTCHIVLSLKQEPNGNALQYPAKVLGYKSRITEGREKRSVSLIVRGVKALRKVLAGTRQVPTHHPEYRVYEKAGNSGTAIKDFYSIKPANVKDLTGSFSLQPSGRALVGTVGDRRLRLLLDGDRDSVGQPVLEIIDPKTMSGPYVDRIIYKALDVKNGS